jgi:membrane-bound lytic murein transglycosylase MltF
MKNRMKIAKYGVLSAAFCIFWLLFTAGCTKKTPEPKKAENGAVKSIPLLEWTGDLDVMVKRRVIRVLTTYSKTNYFVDRGTQRGLVYDSFQLFEEDMNRKLRKKNIRVHVVILPVAHDELIPALLEGRGDIVAGSMVVTDARKEKVDFSNPTRTGVSVIAVTGPGAPPIKRVEDLAGKEVYLRLSSITPKSVERFNSELAKKGLPPVKIRPAPEVLADEDILEMVNAGIVKTTISLDYIAEFWQQVFPNLVLNKGAAIKTDAQLALMIRKNSPLLRSELNAFLARYPEGSLRRNILLQKYLQSVKYAKSVTSKTELAKVERTREIFRKYSLQYGLDYLFLVALAYQESQLDQNKKSQVGALGVMQLMPSTGAEMKVGDIRKLEPNIHAGIKYIHLMMDRYYADDPMDKLNKALFTVASYNAGPGRINRLRGRASNRGLDPNKWFNNVELLAAESIGRETVQYVANIFKYYLAYRMLMEGQKQRMSARQEANGKP